MRKVFKVIAIIGLLSFVGAFMKGLFFPGGLFVAGIFGYLGWRFKLRKSKLKEKSNVHQYNSRPEIEEKNLNTLNESKIRDLKHNIEEYNRKKDLLIQSYKEGLLTVDEYTDKNEVLEVKSAELSYLYNIESIKKKIFLDNKLLFDRLIDLKTQNLISEEDYTTKYNELFSSLMKEMENNSSGIKKDFETKTFQPSTFNNIEIRDLIKKDGKESIWFFYYIEIIIAGCIVLCVIFYNIYRYFTIY